MLLKELFDQSLRERSYFDPVVRKTLQAQNFTLIGKGRDQQAWQTPQGVLKVFGTQKGSGGQMTEDQKMFQTWVSYTKAHADNPYMPKYGKLESVSFKHKDGVEHLYLQVPMERLAPVPANLQDLLEQFDIFVENGRTFDYLKQIVAQRLGTKFVNTSPLFKTSTLWDTVVDLNNIAVKNGWRLDLGADNYMMRGNQVVIVDPWIAS